MMKTTNPKAKDTKALVDVYYNQTLSGNIETDYCLIAQYDSSVDFSNETWRTDSASRSDLIDQLAEYMEGDTEFISEFAGYIYQNMMVLKERLPDCFKKRDVDALRKLNHMIKPTIVMIGEQSLIEKLRSLEIEWKDGKFEYAKISEINGHADYIKSELEALVVGNRKAA